MMRRKACRFESGPGHRMIKETSQEKEPKKEKPEFLYHGTQAEDLEILSPDDKRTRGFQEGKLLFATPDKGFAATFLGPRPDDSWSIRGRVGGRYYILISDEKRFRDSDKGGIIYTLPGDKFECDESKGIRRSEWHAKSDVRPIETERFDSALDAMAENGVLVYFVDKKKLDEIKKYIEDSLAAGKTSDTEKYLDELEPAS